MSYLTQPADDNENLEVAQAGDELMQDRNTHTRPFGLQRMNDFFKSLIGTAIPFVALVIIMSLMAGRGGELLWALGVVLCPVALAVSAGFAIAGKRGTALGVLAGTGILLLGLIVGCSVALM